MVKFNNIKTEKFYNIYRKEIDTILIKYLNISNIDNLKLSINPMGDDISVFFEVNENGVEFHGGFYLDRETKEIEI